MPNFRYTARDERGNAVSGTLTAANLEALADHLKRTGYLVTKAQEVNGHPPLERLVPGWTRVRYDDLVLFNVQLAKMVQVGIPLVTALQTLAQQAGSPRLQATINDVASQVEAGTSFSEALARHTALFSPLFISMVRAGEVSGKLDQVLKRLAEVARRQAELRQELVTAMTYPILLLIVGMAAMAFLLAGIIPKFMIIFSEAGVPLPLPTLLLHVASQLLRRYWIVLLAVLVLGMAGWRGALHTPPARRQLDRLLLKLPLLGELVRKAAIARMATTLETLFSSGVPVLESLSIAEQTCGNAVIGDVCRTAQASVQQGGSLAEPLRASREIPPMVVQMVAAGESSGTVDHMLAEIAAHYEELVRHGIKRLTTLVEPFFLLLMGGMVAMIMASILLPLFRLVNVIK